MVIVVTGGNKRLLITTPYHSYYQMVRLRVVIVVIKKEGIIYKYNHWIHADNHSLELLRNINKTFLPFSCNFQILYVSLQKHLCTKL